MSAELKSEKLVRSVGRPRKVIDATQFEELCRIQCTLEEIAGVFRVHSDTVQNWCKENYGEIFSVVYKRFSADGRACLRRLQVKWAEKNPTLALWLGKQWLGQSDKVEVEHSIKTDLEKAVEILEDQRRVNGRDSDFPEDMKLSDYQIFKYAIKPRFPELRAEQLEIVEETE